MGKTIGETSEDAAGVIDVKVLRTHRELQAAEALLKQHVRDAGQVRVPDARIDKHDPLNVFVLGAYRNFQLVGAAHAGLAHQNIEHATSLGRRDAVDALGRLWMLHSIAVIPADRNLGSGRRLIDTLESSARRLGREQIVAVIETDMLSGFYARTGYTLLNPGAHLAVKTSAGREAVHLRLADTSICRAVRTLAASPEGERADHAPEKASAFGRLRARLLYPRRR